MSTSNRKYKDSVFVDLFSEDEKAKENFLSLYNALHNSTLEDIEQLKNIRLDQVLYMTFYNDVSYLVDNKIIVLAEHQSTINPNMPLRCLEYISRLYETLFESKEKYSRKLLKIPTPEFYRKDMDLLHYKKHKIRESEFLRVYGCIFLLIQIEFHKVG